MPFSSPLLTDAMQEKNRKLGRWLLALIVGLFVFSILYIIFDN